MISRQMNGAQDINVRHGDVRGDRAVEDSSIEGR